MSEINQQQQQQQQTPQVPPRSVERVQQLELMIQELKRKNSDYENENVYLRAFCQQLQSQLAQCKPTANLDENSSIVAIDETYVDVGITNICAEIENYLVEANEKFTDERTFKPAFEVFINRLSTLITLQYSSKDLIQLKKLKDELIKKLSLIDQKMQMYAIKEHKLADLETQFERMTTEYNAVKTAFNCKQMIDTNQVDVLTDEFLKWKDEIKAINSKVQEQNSLIQQLVQKCDPMIESTYSKNETSTDKTVVNLQDSLIQQPLVVDEEKKEIVAKMDETDVSPGTSPSEGLNNIVKNILLKPTTDYTSYDIIETGFNTIRTNSSGENTNINNNNDNENTTLINNDVNKEDNNNNSVNDNNNSVNDINNSVNDIDHSVKINDTNDVNNEVSNTIDDTNNVDQVPSIKPDDNINDNNINNATINDNVNQYNTIPSAPSEEDNNNSITNTYVPEAEENAKSLQIYQCPICFIEVSKDTFSFPVFYEHVSKCDSNQLTCIFCLKLFNKSKSNEYIQHVQEHE